MKPAWEYAREITDNAEPRLLGEEEQLWTANFSVEEFHDNYLKLMWNSNVPGSAAPESIMLAAIQAKENLGYTVKDGVELWQDGQEAVKNNDMVLLNKITARLWNNINTAEKDLKSPVWKYKRYNHWSEYEKDVEFIEAEDIDRSTLKDRLYAGWIAQIIGGAIGTMIEGYTTRQIRKKFGEVRSYLRKPNTYNDDITYELAFLFAYLKYGKEITSRQIAEYWAGYVPSGWSAEDIALRNIKSGIMPPLSAEFGNPFYEWIGAQMRGAICGMVAPGNPKEAARLAWLDGQISHLNNGIIGEIFNAMLVSLAFVEDDVRTILEKAFAMLPKKSEYYGIAKFAFDAAKKYDRWEEAWAVCEKRVERYNWIHAYPNVCAEVIALWYGQNDFDEVAYIISMAGQDVDCNAAQILTIIGIVEGLDSIREEWRKPFGNVLDTYLRKYKQISINELAEKTFEAAIKN